MQYFKAGKLVAVYGVKGELLLKHQLGKKSSLKDATAIFTQEKNASFFPWFIERTKIKTDTETLLKLEGVNTREAAALLLQKEIWITEKDFKRLAARSAPANLLGYTLHNKNEVLSDILEIIEQPHQRLCRIEFRKKEVLIPLIEDFLIKIDHKKKIVIVDLPEGLIEIYQ